MKVVRVVGTVRGTRRDELPERGAGLTDILCNLCGQSCIAGTHRHATAEGWLGAQLVGTDQEQVVPPWLEVWHLDLCQHCLGWLVSQFKIPPNVSDALHDGPPTGTTPHLAALRTADPSLLPNDATQEAYARAMARSRMIEKQYLRCVNENLQRRPEGGGPTATADRAPATGDGAPVAHGAIEEVEGRLAGLGAEQQRLKKQRDDLLRQTSITCQSECGDRGCRAELRIGDLTYIQTHWYEGPHGCTEGDMWHPADGEFECPQCGLRNNLRWRKHYKELRHLFHEIKNEYKRR
jgi:hypothetical protein